MHPSFRPQYNTSVSYPNTPQWNTSVDNDFDMAGNSLSSGQQSQTPKVNNQQKTSERMAEDESNINIFDLIL